MLDHAVITMRDLSGLYLMAHHSSGPPDTRPKRLVPILHIVAFGLYLRYGPMVAPRSPRRTRMHATLYWALVLLYFLLAGLLLRDLQLADFVRVVVVPHSGFLFTVTRFGTVSRFRWILVFRVLEDVIFWWLSSLVGCTVVDRWWAYGTSDTAGAAMIVSLGLALMVL